MNYSDEKITEGHIFYSFNDEDTYLENLISYILSGLENHQIILVIENMKVLPKLKEKLNVLFTKEQLTYVRMVNNFDYYLSNGDFNTTTIVNHFESDLSALKNRNLPIRTWAHVEWYSSEPDAELLNDFETIADEFVLQKNTLSVCAYPSERLTSELSILLRQAHKYFMTDNNFSLSSLYNRTSS
ncbi:MEDS domain-containing protein [Fictibacillus sp. FJAT-27399]|uniref:MEDS domain-containing protein n=1 Tax=Fictibacillus sp. FJAT-27399 TaxID=1729689 RepID=UPI0007855EFF|nr:MEDS domain-containing protein [Fictibacillus sp. FJAT-27399]